MDHDGNLWDTYLYLLSAQVLKAGSELSSAGLGSEPQEYWGQDGNSEARTGGAQR